MAALSLLRQLVVADNGVDFRWMERTILGFELLGVRVRVRVLLSIGRNLGLYDGGKY